MMCPLTHLAPDSLGGNVPTPQALAGLIVASSGTGQMLQPAHRPELWAVREERCHWKETKQVQGPYLVLGLALVQVSHVVPAWEKREVMRYTLLRLRE